MKLSHLFGLPFFTTAALAAAISLNAQAEQTAVGDDGREIILKDDGSWEYKSTDRYATSESGSRVLLKDNGEWEFVGNMAGPKVRTLVNAPVMAQAPGTTHVENNFSMELGDVIMHSKKNKIPNTNSYRVESKTEINFTVTVSQASKMHTVVDTRNLSLFDVSDDRGNEYEVMSVSPKQVTLEPGKTYGFTIWIDEGPKYQLMSLGRGIKELEIDINHAAFATPTDIKLVKKVKDIKEMVNGKLEK